MTQMTAVPDRRRPYRLRRALPWLVAALTAAGTVFAFLESPNGLPDNLAGAAGPVLFTVLGVLIALRQPGNRIAWLFLLISPAYLIEVIGMRLIADHAEPPSLWAVLTLAGINSSFFIGGALAFLVLHLFPTGHYLTRRWSWAGWFAIGASAEAFVVYLFLDTVGLSGFPGEDWSTHNPFGFIPSESWVNGGPLQLIFGGMLLAVIFGAIPAVVVRYRRSDQTVRTQIKWVTFSFVMFAVLFAVNLLTPGEGDIWGLLMSISLAMIPVAIASAIVRYRLFDIDRIISRTLSYAIVVTVLAAAFFGLVALITALLSTQNSLAVAASTLAVAALFNPLRKRVQHRVDRRFNRSAYQADELVEHFSVRLRESLDVDELTELWLQTTTDSVQPQIAGIWLNPDYAHPERP